MKPLYVISQNSATVISGGSPFMVANDQPQFEPLVAAIRAQDWDTVHKIATGASSYGEALAAFGGVTVYGGHVVRDGEELHGYLVDQILKADGDIQPLLAFQANVLANPDERARDDLYAWCEESGHQITTDGCFLAYKLVGQDYKDHYTGQFDYSVGAVVEMDRAACDSDPDRTCSAGLHFCNSDYLPSYGSSDSRVMLIKMNPRDVVAFPRDYGLSKGRACRQEVVEEIDRETAKTYFDDFTGFWAPKLFVIKSDKGYFLAEGEGVTFNIDEAHRYNRVEAEALAFSNPDWIIPAEGEADTIAERVERLADQLDLHSDGMITALMEDIESELDLDGSGTLIERVEAAERQLGL